MGSPDAFIETPQGTIFLDLKTIQVEAKSMSLRTIRDMHPRFPRKLKKRLKAYHGDNYKNWLNSQIKWIPELNSDIYSYHNADAEKELTQLLLDNESNENKQTS